MIIRMVLLYMLAAVGISFFGIIGVFKVYDTIYTIRKNIRKKKQRHTERKTG